MSHYQPELKSLKPGYICAVHQGFLGKLEHMFNTPTTDFDHFFLLDTYDKYANDWIIIESIASRGVSIGRLSWYADNFDVYVYRPNDWNADSICARAASLAVRYGRKSYDWPAIISVVIVTLHEMVKQLIKFKKPQVPYTVYKHSDDKHVICTELVGSSFHEAGYDVFDPNYLATPPNFMQQCINGKTIQVCIIPAKKNNLLYRALYRAGYGLIKQNVLAAKTSHGT